MCYIEQEDIGEIHFWKKKTDKELRKTIFIHLKILSFMVMLL